MLISETARREKRPGHIILRASKMIASSGWMGENYRLLYKSPEELMHFLGRVPVGVLVLDQSDPREHSRLLLQTMENYPERWTLMSTRKREGGEGAGEILVYRQQGQADKTRNPIQIDMRRSLGRFIGK